MTTRQRLYLSVAAVGLLGWLAGAPAQLGAQTTVAIDNDDIGGVVTGASGPEAGVEMRVQLRRQIAGNRDWLMRRLRASLASSHPGGFGARPGGTMTPVRGAR